MFPGRVVEVGDLSQGVAHGDEIKPTIGKGEARADALHERNVETIARLGDHPERRIDTRHATGSTDQLNDFARQEARARTNVQYLHPLAQPGASERFTAIGLTGTERHDVTRAVIMFSGSIEQSVDNALPVRRAAPILGFCRERWLIHSRASCGDRLRQLEVFSFNSTSA